MQRVLRFSILTLSLAFAADSAQALDCVFKYQVQQNEFQQYQLELREKPNDPDCVYCLPNQQQLSNARENWRPGQMAALGSGWAYVDGLFFLSLTLDSQTCETPKRAPVEPSGPR